MKKEDIVIEIYRIRNQINALTGSEQYDLTDRRWQGRMYEESRKSDKPSLERQLERIKEEFEWKKKNVAYEKQIAEYYSTPEGIEHKKQTEAAIKNKISEWKEYDRQQTNKIEELIQKELGSHWGVCRFNKGFLEIGVIDSEKSTSEQRGYYFGQSIDIRYEEKKWGSGSEEFTSGCASAGSFDMEGGATVGERAMFYVGIGQLYNNAELVASIKQILKESSRKISAMGDELEKLRKQLSHPIPEESNS